MFKSKVPFLFTVLILAMIVSVFYTLTLVDNIVHGSLYDYGLRFSLDWANPYWTTLRIVQVLLCVTAAVTVFNAVYNYWTQASAELKAPKILKTAAEPKLGRFEAEPRKIEPTRIEPKVNRNEVKPKVEVKKPELKMNHIYFTALVNGTGLAAALTKGDGRERVYIVEPTGSFENDPNVTDKKFPGNPTRSYRSQEPLKIIGEVTDWVRQTPDELQKWREKLANNKGEIIN